MKILIDLQACQDGSHGRGIGRYALAMARALVRAGQAEHDFRILLSDRFPERIKAIRQAFVGLLPQEDVVVISVPANVASASPENLWRTRAGELSYMAAMEGFEPDVFFTPSLFEGFWEEAVTGMEPGEYLRAATVHDLIPLEDPDFYLTGDFSKRAYSTKIAAMRRCDYLFSVSDYTKSQVESRLGIDGDKVITLTLGVEPEFCVGAVSAERERDIRQRYGLPGRFIINTSPYEARKNILGLIAGFACVAPESRKAVQLVIAGKMSPHDKSEIFNAAQREGLEPSDVVLPGFVSDADLIDLYRLCESMVFPPLSEGFGLPPLEAMACGAAVIASNATSVPEVIGRKDALFDPSNPGEMGRLIQKVLDDEAFRDDLRTFGPQQAARFSWDISAQKMLQAFEAGQKRKARRTAAVSPRTLVRKIAVATVTGTLSSRETGLVENYVRLLSGQYEVVVFPLKGELSGSLTVYFEQRSGDDFVAAASEFDRVLYILDSSQVHIAEPYMAARPGALMLYDRILGERAETGLTSNQLRDLFAERGYEALSASVDATAAPVPGHAVVVLVDDFAVEGDSRLAGRNGARTITPHVPLAAPDVIENFRRARKIPLDAPIWAAFVADDAAEAEIVRRFRTLSEVDASVWLVVANAADRSADRHAPGQVFRISDAYVGPYRELLASTAAIFVDERLDDRARTRLVADATAHAIPVATFDRLAEGLAAPASSASTSALDAARHAFARDFLGVAEQLLQAAPRPFAAPQSLLDRLPSRVGACRPSEADLDDLARVVVANEELKAKGRILIDVTTPAGSRSEGLPSPVRRFLRGLLRSVGSQAVLVVEDAEGFYRAGRFTSDLLGVASSFFPDERLKLRPSDVLVLIDAVGSAYYSPVAAAGVRVVQLAVEDALLGRPDLGEEIAGAALEEIARAASDVLSKQADGAPERRGRPGRAATVLAKALASPAQPHETLDLKYCVYGHVLGSYSLATVNRRVARVLDECFPGRVRFVPVETSPVEDLSKVPNADRQAIERLLAPVSRSGADVVISQHYPMHPPALSADVGLALLAWEESHLPPATVDLLNARFDGVLAQVQTVHKSLVDSGVWRPSALTGLPVDVKPYDKICRRVGPAKTFLHVSSCFPRKGVDVLLEAWAHAFSDEDGVNLVIKTFPNPHNDVEGQIAELRRLHPRLAPIKVISRDMDQNELVELFRTSDVMVLPTRGEGYNLPALEALAAGLPLIVTGHGGHRDFCGPNEARLLDYDFQMSGSHVKECVSYWANPSVADLVAALREQTRNDRQAEIEARRERGRASARQVTDARRWGSTISEFAQSLLGTVDTGPVRTSWISTWAVRCGIAEYSRFLVENMSPAGRAELTVLADDRILEAEVDDVDKWSAAWEVSFAFRAERLLEAIAREDAEAVVIQHQDGLIFWKYLAQLAMSAEMASRVSVVMLHTVRSLVGLEEDERRFVLSALSRFDRVLVHTVGDLNELKGLGLIDNVALLPHGALRPLTAGPVVRELGPLSAPVIGCHGFFFDHKRIDNLIRAAAKLKSRWPRLRLRLVNARFPSPISDAAIDHARLVAEEVGMTHSIEWHTEFMSVEDIQHLLSGCDLLVLPYDETGDSVSGAVRVAMSSLAPLLTTPVKIFADVADAVASVDSNEPDILAQAIQALLASPRERERLQQSMRRWLDIHDWTRISGTLEGMIKALAIQRRMSGRGARALLAAE